MWNQKGLTILYSVVVESTGHDQGQLYVEGLVALNGSPNQ